MYHMLFVALIIDVDNTPSPSYSTSMSPARPSYHQDHDIGKHYCYTSYRCQKNCALQLLTTDATSTSHEGVY
jgi:hypothetical protein